MPSSAEAAVGLVLLGLVPRTFFVSKKFWVQGNCNQRNKEHKKVRCHHGYRGPVVSEKINTVQNI